MNPSPIVRIVLRYVVGAAFMGSDQIGQQLAADPDLVATGSIAVGAAVECAYSLAKKWGWTT